MINHAILRFLKKINISDTRVVDRLFVSAFLRHYDTIPQFNELLKECNILKGSEEDGVLTELIDRLDNSNFEYTIEELIALFEFVVSPLDRIVTGSVYTPVNIREYIVLKCIEGIEDTVLADLHYADISCGCGGFLSDVALMINLRTGKKFREIFRDNLYGIDIQPYAVKRSKILLSMLALLQGEDSDFDFNIYQADTLNFDFNEIGDFDIIVGNPPYVCARNMSEDSKSLMKNWTVCRSGNPDLYIPFFQVAIEQLRENGRLGYITMNTFLTSLNGRALREYFSDLEYRISIVDFRGQQIFYGKNTYTCLFFLEKKKSETVAYCVNEEKNLLNEVNFQYIPYSQLDNHKGWPLNEFVAYSRYEKIGIPLGEYCQTRHGIATLSNKIYVFNPDAEDSEFYYIRRKGENFQIEKDVCRDIINSNKFNSDKSFDDVVEKIIFPYSANVSGKMLVIEENVFAAKYPYAYAYLLTYKDELLARDKGKAVEYPHWYEYGRSQSLVMPKYKLFFPKIANKPLHCIVSDDDKLLLYNGISFVSNNERKIRILRCILNSDLFWDYVTKNSKPYSSGYYALNGVNIKHFGIPIFTEQQEDELLSFNNQLVINKWLKAYY